MYVTPLPLGLNPARSERHQAGLFALQEAQTKGPVRTFTCITVLTSEGLGFAIFFHCGLPDSSSHTNMSTSSALETSYTYHPADNAHKLCLAQSTPCKRGSLTYRDKCGHTHALRSDSQSVSIAAFLARPCTLAVNLVWRILFWTDGNVTHTMKIHSSEAGKVLGMQDRVCRGTYPDKVISPNGVQSLRCSRAG